MLLRRALLWTSLLWCCIAPSFCEAQCERSWLSTGNTDGPAGSVYGLTMWDSDGAGPLEPWLVAGGYFYTAGHQFANGVAAWDGVQWHDLGFDATYLTREVRSLIVYNDELIAVGQFASTQEWGYAAAVRWNGGEWAPFGKNGAWPGGGGLCATVFNGDLVVAGQLIARWNGEEWHFLPFPH